jgi:hypothetical protein
VGWAPGLRGRDCFGPISSFFSFFLLKYSRHPQMFVIFDFFIIILTIYFIKKIKVMKKSNIHLIFFITLFKKNKMNDQS